MKSMYVGKSVLFGVGALLLVTLSGQAMAQGYGYQDSYGRPVQWHVEGGGAVTTGQTSDYLNSGWTIGTGLTFRPDPVSPFALRADVSFSRFNATNNLIALGEQQNQTQIDDGWADIVNFDLDAVLSVPLSPHMHGYVMAGAGGAWRRIDLTQTVGFGGYYCDPWYGYCGVGIVPGDVLVQREDTTRFAWNAGAGLEFDLPYGRSWFIEARYNRMETSQPTEFVPIRVGMRF